MDAEDVKVVDVYKEEEKEIREKIKKIREKIKIEEIKSP